ncbi:class I SAM-dependent methyltransferase [Aestuariivirga sp.]|uniref:class I SAM-dependent methyltransferase n=1 Tax=Aestuariivirga sp. TaxID=2650926 RepID=UPI0039E2F131
MDAVAQTAYYCCGVRAQDAADPDPICGDTFAQRFMTGEGQRAFAPFANLKMPNASNATRARIIDDLVRERLKRNPRQKIFMVGAGFDTRPYRLGGGDWVEFDQPALLAVKNKLLPVSDCPMPLLRTGVDFVREHLANKLVLHAGTRDALVILEGVTMYLNDDQKRDLFATLQEALPGHTLICDLMTAHFAEKVALPFRKVLRKLGTDFVPQPQDPKSLAFDERYALEQRISIIGRARAFGAISIPGFLFHTFLRKLRDGYAVHVFRAP